jgi:hypothetical protein
MVKSSVICDLIRNEFAPAVNEDEDQRVDVKP